MSASPKIPSGEEFKAKITARQSANDRHDFKMVTERLNKLLLDRFEDEDEDCLNVGCSFKSETFKTSWTMLNTLYSKLEEHYKKQGYALKTTQSKDEEYIFFNMQPL